MNISENPDSGVEPGPHSGQPNLSTVGLYHLLDREPATVDNLDSSTQSDLRACIGVLDRVWPQANLPTAEQRPESLGRFRIIRELGRGGFGVVFLAEDPVLGRKVALKVPRVEVLSHSDAWRQFRREALAASRLDHPNLVPLLETGQIGPVGYIASVYVEGPSLETWLLQHKGLMPPRQAAQLVSALALAMEHAHQRNILHRDLKPGNVLLQETRREDAATSAHGFESLPFVPRICDFGLAKLLEVEAEESRSMIVAGSPSYMAPEQAEARKDELGPATDVYSLGAILYELLTGRPPFRGKSGLETLRQVVADDPMAPRRVRPGIPRDLEVICLACLAKRPERRYPSARALAEDLERFRSGRPILARPVSIWERAWKWSWRRPALTSLAILSLVALVAGFLGLLVLLRLNDQRTSALKQASRLLASQRVRQADQAASTGNLELAQNLLGLAGPDLGTEGARGFAWNYLHHQVMNHLETLEGHQAPVRTLEGTPDGHILASGDDSGAVRLWNLKTGESFALEPRHHGGVRYLSFSPDGRTLASTCGAPRSEIYLWNVATATFLGRALHVGPTIHAVWFTPDGAGIVALNQVPLNHPHRLVNWECAKLGRESRISDGPKLRELGLLNPQIQAIADLLDGKDSTSALAKPWTGPGPRGLTFTLDGTLLVVGQGNGRFQVLETQSGVKLVMGQIHRTGAAEIVYHPADITPQVRNHVDLLESFSKRHGHENGPIVTGIFEPWCALSSREHEAALWIEGRPGPYLVDTRTWRQTASSNLKQDLAVTSMTCLSDEATVAFGSGDHRLHLWKRYPPRDPPFPRGHEPAEAWSAAYRPDSSILATSGDDHLIRFWDPASGVERATLRGPDSLIGSIAWSPDGRKLAGASLDKNRGLCLWDPDSGSTLFVRSAHNASVRAVAFSPDGRTLASGGDDHTVRLWDPENGRLLATLADHSGRVCAVTFTPDGRTLASGGLDRRILLTDLLTLRNRTLAIGSQVAALAFAPDGVTLAAAYYDGPPKLWNAETRKLQATLFGHTGYANHVAFSPDGKSVATAGMDMTLRIWDSATGQEMLCLTGHQARVNGVAFSPDGRTLASVDHTGAIRLWRAAGP